MLLEAYGETHTRVQEAAQKLVEIYGELGQPERAEPYRKYAAE